MNPFFTFQSDDLSCTKQVMLEELEALLKFTYLRHNAFEGPHDAHILREKGMAKYHSNNVSAEAQNLGAQFIENIKKAYLPNVSIRWVNARVGYGLFAEEALEAHSYIGEYTGIVRKNDRRYF